MATPISDRPEVAMSVYNDRDSFSSLLSFPADASAHSMLLIFRRYEYKRPGDIDILNLNNETLSNMRLRGLTGIELPIPPNLRDVDSLRMDRFEQGFFESLIGGYVADMARGVADSNISLGELPGQIQSIGADLARYMSGGTVGSDISGLINSIMGAGSNASLGAASRDAMYILRSQLPSNITRVSDAIIGSTVNPKASLTFEGVELKNHSFNWTLAPKSSRESDILNNIINTLKRNSLPTYQGLSADNNFKAYLRYPSIVDIYLLGVNAEYFMKFKPAMIRTLTVDYSSQGLVSVLKGGKPAVVNLSLDLMEMDIHTANDYYGDYSRLMTDTNGDQPGR